MYCANDDDECYKMSDVECYKTSDVGCYKMSDTIETEAGHHALEE